MSWLASEPRLPSDALHSMRCMIVEDQVLIGLSLEAYLEELGITAEGPFTQVSQAMGWLETNTPHIAILDYRLAEESCTPVARVLRDRGIPFLIYSAYPSQAASSPVFAGARWLEKPCSREDVAAALISVTECLQNG